MLKSWLSIGVVSFLLIGCADSSTDKEAESKVEETNAVTEESSVPTDTEVTYTVTEAPNNAEKATSTNVKLNPPHGEPGHDCAIAVGAPLDGSGGQAQPSFEPNLATKPAVQSQPSNQRLNPAHGQPGHDCAVAVGAPLPAK